MSQQENPYEIALREQLPQAVVISCAEASDWETKVLPAEEELIQQSVSKRQQEFRAGRHCAHRVLDQLGYKDYGLLRSEKRAPLWPEGIKGSISHSASACAAVATSAPDICSVGIDIEEHTSLKDKLTKKICTAAECEQLDTLANNHAWKKIIFSVKESIYKAWHPVFGTYLDFLEASIRFNDHGHIAAITIRPKIAPAQFENYVFTANYRIAKNYIVATTLCSLRHNSTTNGSQQAQQHQQ